jgi:hypothetical protein
MKIGYLDLNIQTEDYSINAKKYGGAACFARYAKEYLNNGKDEFYIFGSSSNFENLEEHENKKACITLSLDDLIRLRNGIRISEIIKNAEEFDIFLYHHDCLFINIGKLKSKLVHWSLMGDCGAQHPYTPYTLLYRPNEKAKFGKGFPVVIGKYVPDEFIDSERDGSIFVCSRHDNHQNSIFTAKFCLENNIKGIFAGPIFDNYPLLDYIDKKTTFYLGLISEKEKNEYLKKSSLSVYPHTWNTAFNLSVVESLAMGTPIIAYNKGCFEYLLIEGENGYYLNNNNDNILDIYNKCLQLDRTKVWESAKRFSHKKMIETFYSAFKKILYEN